MALQPIIAICTNCRTKFRETPKRTFLGFQKLRCPKCLQQIIYPLTAGYRVTYWTLLCLAIIAAVSQGNIPIPGGLGIAMIIAIVRDVRIRRRIGVETASSSPFSSPLASSTCNVTEVGNEELWALALAELEGETRRSGLWAKAFADAQGNETAAKANYLRARVRQLTEENRSRTAEARQRKPTVALAQSGRRHDSSGVTSTITAAFVTLWVIVLAGLIGWAIFS